MAFKNSINICLGSNVLLSDHSMQNSMHNSTAVFLFDFKIKKNVNNKLSECCRSENRMQGKYKWLTVDVIIWFYLRFQTRQCRLFEYFDLCKPLQGLKQGSPTWAVMWYRSVTRIFRDIDLHAKLFKISSLNECIEQKHFLVCSVAKMFVHILSLLVLTITAV